MCDLKCNILTEKYIDKILEPLKSTNGKILELSQSYIERDFHKIRKYYYVWIKFANISNKKKFIKLLKESVVKNKKYSKDFFLEVL